MSHIIIQEPVKTSSRNLLKEILHYLRKPTYIAKNVDRPLRSRIYDITTLTAWNYTISFVLGILITVLLDAIKYSGSHAVETFTTNNSIFMSILLIIIIVPLLEEAAFRLPLRYKSEFLAISLFFFLNIAMSLIINFFAISDQFSLILIFASFFSTLLYVLLKKGIIGKKLEYYYVNHFGKIFYTSILIFGILHITNYSNLFALIYLIPLLVLPQIIGGLSIAYVRMHHGFWAGYGFHMLFNAILILPVLLSTVIKDEAILGLIGIPILAILGYGAITLIISFFRLFGRKSTKIT